MEDLMQVRRILETALYAEDLIAAEAFYTGVLGLEVHSRGPGRHVFFRSGEGMFLVFNPNQTEQETAPHGCRGSGHAAWAVAREELDAWRNWLETKGVKVNDFRWPEGGRSLYFRDPAGNSLELTTPQLWNLA
jgi:catechol 2,3-dioxygenase-like lactoylglutathione lyase family enzyme